MTKTRTTITRRLAVAATAATAAVLPFQAGVAHASTPEEDLNACVSTAVANMGDTFSADIDACVNAYLVELGIDPATMTFDATTTTVATPDPSAGTVTVDAGTVATGDSGATADTVGAAAM